MIRSLPLRADSGVFVSSLAIIICIVVAFVMPIPGGVDWYESFRPAMQALVTGRSPYVGTTDLRITATAHWGLFAFSPLLLLSPQNGRALFFAFSLIGFGVALRRLRASPAALALFLLSPPVIHSLLNGNIDWLPILGFTLRPAYGVFLLSLKPQMGSVVVLVWVLQIWRRDGVKAVLREFLPFAVTLLVSIAPYGFWFREAERIVDYSRTWNASLWPASIPVGLLLLTHALKRLDVKSACAASPCLSPYVLFHAWSGALSALADNTLYMLVTVVGLWLLVILRSV